MKAKFLFGFLFLLHYWSFSQVFDSIAYRDFYKEHLEKYYYEDEFNEATKIAGLSKAWAEAKFNFVNFDLVPNLNWDSLYHSFIPRVREAPTPIAYYEELIQFYTALSDGHSLIIPPQNLWDSMAGYLPIKTKLIEGQVVIFSLNSEHLEFEVLKPGTLIVGLNGLPTIEYAKKYIEDFVPSSTPQDKQAKTYSYFLTNGDISKPITLDLITVDGESITKDFTRISRSAQYLDPGSFNYELINEYTGLLTISTFNRQDIVPFLDSIFQKLPHAHNLIIDIRENGGGNSNNGFELLGYLTEKPFPFGINVQRQYRPTYRAWQQAPDKLSISKYEWKPYKGPVFKGKVVVLTGPLTYSAAEDFLVAFKAVGRGTLIGQITGGSTGQPLFFELPFGGKGAVCAKRDLMTDFTEFVGIGIPPDVEIDYTLEKFRAGEDEGIHAALRHFAGED